MDAAYITPFIKSIQNVFSTMLQLQVKVEQPHLKTNNNQASYDVSGIIGLSGDVVGSIVLSFPTDAAQRIVALFTGTNMSISDPDFPDAVGELVNMISGNAKAEFKGKQVSISCPSVVIGKDHQIGRPREIPCIAIPCSTDCGNVVIEISIQESTATSAASSNRKTAAAV